ncbi:hypothetical protein chiPu_0009968 [Chiloscyllium punctatum]|uniref:Uncharacterized protein n=1 Tax=Chiloscyllium punctatum TaxID=137246 RepID=A0A401SMA1_CHIPU|nr:hypothetical protein [Chiloscyllium punctatum]
MSRLRKYSHKPARQNKPPTVNTHHIPPLQLVLIETWQQLEQELSPGSAEPRGKSQSESPPLSRGAQTERERELQEDSSAGARTLRVAGTAGRELQERTETDEQSVSARKAAMIIWRDV